jgi:hypothetical protein
MQKYKGYILPVGQAALKMSNVPREGLAIID